MDARVSQNPSGQDYVSPPAEDDISLIDAWLVLVRRKRLFLAVLSLFLIAGFAAALLPAKKYAFTAAIEVGTATEDGKSVRIENISTVLAKIKESYIPEVVQGFVDKHPDEAVPEIEARIPARSELIVLEGKGTKRQSETYTALLRAVLDYVAKDHARVTDVIRSRWEADLARKGSKLDELRDDRIFTVAEEGLKNQIRAAEARLLTLQDQAGLLKKRYRHIEETKKLLDKSVAETRQLIAAAIENRRAAVGEAAEATRAMSLMMIDMDVQQNRNRLTGLEERRHIHLPEEREKLDSEVARNEREQDKQGREVARLKAELKKLRVDRDYRIERQSVAVGEAETALSNLRPTRALTPPMRSVGSVGPSGALLVICGAILGIISGFFGVFFAEMLGRVEKTDHERVGEASLKGEPVPVTVAGDMAPPVRREKVSIS